uniref:Uncharacterized protein n=1 Tax=Dunaliella tertiolecta TaxID=3047 RepID=A0A7S3QTR3_DUNTE
MEAGHQVPTQTPRSSHCEEASKYNQAQNPWQPMCHNIWTQTGSKAGTKKRGRRSKRGRHRVRCREGLKRGAKGGRQQSAKIKKLLAGGSEMLLRGQQEAANRRQLTQGCKKPAEGRAASRWWDSIWEDPEGQQQRASAEGNRQGLQGDAQCQKEEGALTEVVELLRRLELAVSKKEYAWALNSHPGALDDVQPALRLVPASSQQHGSSDCGRSGTHSIRMEQQPQQGAAFAVENGGHAQGAPFSPSLFALKKAWLGADQALRVCGAATVAPSLPPQTVYQDVFLDSSTQYALPEYQEAPRISSQWTEVPPQTTAPKLPSLTVSLQAAEGCAAVGSAGTEDSTSRYGGREQHSEPSEFLTTLACKSSSASAKGSSREAAVCARLEQLAALCDIFTRARNGAQQTCI